MREECVLPPAQSWQGGGGGVGGGGVCGRSVCSLLHKAGKGEGAGGVCAPSCTKLARGGGCGRSVCSLLHKAGKGEGAGGVCAPSCTKLARGRVREECVLPPAQSWQGGGCGRSVCSLLHKAGKGDSLLHKAGKGEGTGGVCAPSCTKLARGRVREECVLPPAQSWQGGGRGRSVCSLLHKAQKLLPLTFVAYNK